MVNATPEATPETLLSLPRQDLRLPLLVPPSLLCQHALAAGNHPRPPLVVLAGSPQGPRKGLECGLDNVVAVLPSELPDVQGRTRGVDEGLEKVLHHLTVKGADALCGDRQVKRQVRAPGEVQHHVGQSLVQWCREFTEAMNAPSVAQRLGHGRAQSQRDILHRVMVVDPSVSGRTHGQVEQPVGGDLVEHVVKEPHWGLSYAYPCSVQVDGDFNLSLFGLSSDSGDAGWHRSWL